MIILLIFILAIIAELLDSSLGMLYGTLLSPLLILLGFDPLIVVPSILLSQAIGGIVATIRHHKFNNAEFCFQSKDFKVGIIIFSLGIVAVLIGTLLAIKIDKNILKTYISILVILMGLLVVLNLKFKFSWKSITLLGLLSSFNKSLSGGGFGPVLSTGQIILGRESKNSVATTDFAEVPICLTGFAFWFFISSTPLNLYLLSSLCLGSIIGAYFGPFVLSKIKNENIIKKIIGGLAIILGLLLLFTKISI